jgi:RHS repeat-associated protein
LAPPIFSYDNNGNTLTKTDSTGITNYTWDFENRMTSVTPPGSSGMVSFKYDPFGRRIYKSSSSGTSIYAYDGDNLVEETNNSGASVARYSQGLNIDEPLAMLRSSTTSYYQADGLGSVTSLTNAAGTAAQNYTYDSFGNIIAATGSLVNSFRYTGREWDTETSLYYYRARYYDPQSGRFLSEDRIRFRGGVDFYPYVGGNPLNALDPSGMLVMAVYYKGTGQLTVTDLNTGETVVINVESGGKPFGDPIPNGVYDLLEQQRKPDEFRLDKQDETPYDDVDDATGRDNFRLHHPGRTIGCIAAKDWKDWNKVFNLISNTKTSTVPDNFKPWWKFWSSPGSLRDFGTLTVVP